MQIGKNKIEEHNNSLLRKHKRRLDFINEEIKDSENILQKLIAFQIAIPSWALGTGGTRKKLKISLCCMRSTNQVVPYRCIFHGISRQILSI